MNDQTCPTCGHDPGDLATAYLCGAAGIGGKWTRMPPREPGWYWVLRGDQRDVAYLTSAASVFMSGTLVPYDLMETNGWLWHSTPIPMPPLPEGE